MHVQLLVSVILATAQPKGAPPPPRFDTNFTAVGFVTSASVSVSLRSLPNGETAAVIDMENLRVTKRSVDNKARGNFNLRFLSEMRAGRAVKGRVRPDSTRRVRPDSTHRVRADSTP